MKNIIINKNVFVILALLQYFFSEANTKQGPQTEVLSQYDSAKMDFVSIHDKKTDGSQLLFYKLSITEKREKRLIVVCPFEVTLFVDNNLAYRSDNFKIGLDSLRKIHKKDNVLLTFYGTPRLIGPDDLVIDFVENLHNGSDLTVDGPVLRAENPLPDFLMVFLLLFFTLIAIVKTGSGQLIADIFNWGRIFSLNAKDESYFRNDVFSANVFVLFAIFCLIISFSFNVAHWLQDSIGGPYSVYIIDLAKTFGTVTVIVIGKIMIIGIFSKIFNFSGLFSVHALEYIRYSITANIVIAVLALIIYVSGASFVTWEMFFYLWIATIVFRIVILTFKLNSIASFHFFHLFSYICATEIVPFFWLAPAGYHFFG